MKNSSRVDIWRDRLAACRENELSVSEYCQQYGLATRRFYYWKLRIAKLDEGLAVKDKPIAPSDKWLCIEPEPAVAPHRDFVVVKIAGAEIEIGTGFNPTLLRSVVKALGPDPC
jgi:hypothetical protein